MLSIKGVFYFSLLQYFVCGKIVQSQPSNPHSIPITPQKDPDSTTPSEECPPDKSLNSRIDIKVLIDHVYNETSLDNTIKQNYQFRAEAISNKHLKDLSDFTAWFDNEPEHLEEVLQRIDKMRKVQVEPVVKIVAGVLSKYPALEMSYNEKNDNALRLITQLNRYMMVCKFNCDVQQVTEHNIAKRNVKEDFYCSSLEDLHKEITGKLDDSVKKINNNSLNSILLDDKKYEEKIVEIKSKLKDKALKEFGRTMYDILTLEFDYHRFMIDITGADVHNAVYDIKQLELQIDTQLLKLEQAVEEIRQHCSSCGLKNLVRSLRRADVESEEISPKEQPNVVNELIEMKFEEITAEIESDRKNIFHDLNESIQISSNEKSMEKLKIIQGKINEMTKVEKETLSKLEEIASIPSIKKLLELIKKLVDLLKLIKNIIDNLPE